MILLDTKKRNIFEQSLVLFLFIFAKRLKIYEKKQLNYLNLLVRLDIEINCIDNDMSNNCNVQKNSQK